MGWTNQLKISAPLPLKEAYRLIPLSAYYYRWTVPFNYLRGLKPFLSPLFPSKIIAPPPHAPFWP
jgi:hypothetical protein